VTVSVRVGIAIGIGDLGWKKEKTDNRLPSGLVNCLNTNFIRELKHRFGKQHSVRQFKKKQSRSLRFGNLQRLGWFWPIELCPFPFMAFPAKW
jgi:hypothetical protein